MSRPSTTEWPHDTPYGTVSQRAVAELTGLTVYHLSLLENGDRIPSVETLNRLGEAFGVPASWITMLGTPAPKRSEFTALTEATESAIRAAIKVKASVG